MNTSECIKNMLNTRQGEHCLFRSFGLGAITDRVGRLYRSDISNAVEKWYPNVTDIVVKQNSDSYDVQIREIG